MIVSSAQPLRILVLSFYYPPDLSAGSFRCDAFIRTLRNKLPAGAQVDVLTTMPNRYLSYREQAPPDEDDGIVRVRRFRLPRHSSGMADQVGTFASYAWQVWRSVGRQSYDLVFATSSRMFTGWLGAICARRTGARFYLEIRDIFNDSIGDVLRGPGMRMLMPGLDRVERYTVRSADHVNLISEGFLDYFQERYPEQSFSTYPNGIDEEFLGQDFSGSQQGERARRRVLYAGNIGQGQGLHRILPGLAAASMDSAEFVVFGDGGARRLLERALAEWEIGNVELRFPIPRAELLTHYADADVLFLHLNDLPAFRRVLPSKLFEYAATHKPILAGVSGFAARFLSENVANVGIFQPCDADDAARALHRLSLEPARRENFIERFRRRVLMEHLVDDVLSVVQPETPAQDHSQDRTSLSE